MQDTCGLIDRISLLAFFFIKATDCSPMCMRRVGVACTQGLGMSTRDVWRYMVRGQTEREREREREREKKRGKEKETEEKQRPANQKHSIYTRRPHMNEAVASAGPGTTPGHHTCWNSDMKAILSLVSRETEKEKEKERERERHLP